MTNEEIRTFILELKDMCDIQMNKDGVDPSHRVGVYDQFDIKLRQLERSDNSNYEKCLNDLWENYQCKDEWDKQDIADFIKKHFA